MKNLQFIKHIGEACPLGIGAYVVYRTTSEDSPVSHIHLPMHARDLNWSKSPAFGRILDYAVAPKPKLAAVSTKRVISR